MLSQFAIEQVFDAIWEKWINKEGESSAKKAVNVYFKSGNSKDDLLKACESYRLDNISTDPEFTYKLSNFINQDHWRDALEGNTLDKLKKDYDLANEIIKCWNDTRKEHWCNVANPETRIGLVMSSLRNAFFRANWRNALDMAGRIFKHKLDSSEPRGKIILSITWFANVSPNKHVVAKIIDGEYGKPKQDSPQTKSQKSTIDPDPVARAEALKVLQELAGDDFKIYKPKPVIEKRNEPTKEAIEFTDTILKSIGSSYEEVSEGDDPHALF